MGTARQVHSGRWSWKTAALYVAKGSVVGALLLGAQRAVEHSSVGAWIETRTYSAIMNLLPTFRRDGHEVVVLDIGHLRSTRPGPVGKVAPTPTQEIRELLDALADAPAAAVGIDIDFSPGVQGWIRSDDPEFFEQCLRYGAERRMPVRVGVHRSMREPQEAWLGLPDYSPLAGALWLPKRVSARLPVWIATPSHNSVLPTLGAAVSASLQGQHAEYSSWRSMVFAPIVSSDVSVESWGGGVTIGSTAVNYSSMDQLEREANIRGPARAEYVRANPERFRGKVVLIGDVTGATQQDIFPVPNGEVNRRGVLLHAALAQTLLVDRLWEFSPSFRLGIDIVLTMSILSAVAITRCRSRAAISERRAEALEDRVVIVAVASVLIAGLTLVLLRVVWLDFLLVSFFLLAHSRVQRLLVSLLPHRKD